MKWQHPTLGEIEEMKRCLQEKKGWKHLYQPLERWDQLIDEPAERLHSQARANGCPAWRPPGDRHPRLNSSCNRCLHRHHDKLWRDAYGAELVATTDLIGRSRRGLKPVVLASPRGVWLVLTAPSADAVFDVYRPQEPGKGVDWTEADFAAQARRRFWKETGMKPHTTDPALLVEVARPADAWHLALAVGMAQAANRPEDRDALASAKARLAALDDSTRHAALPDREALFDVIEHGLHDESETIEDATIAVLAAEDALVATELLLGEEAAAALRDELEGLVAWAPVAWLGLEELVNARSAETSSVAQAWWESVQVLLGALQLSEVEPVQSVSTPIADRMAAPAWWRPSLERLQTLGERVRWVLDASDLGWTLAAAQLDEPDGDWWVTPGTQSHTDRRVFAVEDGCETGDDVTDDFAAGKPFWRLETRGQEAWLLRFEGVGTPASLAEALERVASTRGASVSVVRVSRPM